jgi:hypothetical protein
MSLDVPTELLEQAAHGEVADADIVAFISARGQLLNQSPELRTAEASQELRAHAVRGVLLAARIFHPLSSHRRDGSGRLQRYTNCERRAIPN